MGKLIRRDLESSPLPGHLMTLVIYLLDLSCHKCSVAGGPGLDTCPHLVSSWKSLVPIIENDSDDGNCVAVIFLKLHVFLFQVRSPSVNHLLCGWFPGIVREEGQ